MPSGPVRSYMVAVPRETPSAASASAARSPISYPIGWQERASVTSALRQPAPCEPQWQTWVRGVGDHGRVLERGELLPGDQRGHGGPGDLAVGDQTDQRLANSAARSGNVFDKRKSTTCIRTGFRTVAPASCPLVSSMFEVAFSDARSALQLRRWMHGMRRARVADPSPTGDRRRIRLPITDNQRRCQGRRSEYSTYPRPPIWRPLCRAV